MLKLVRVFNIKRLFFTFGEEFNSVEDKLYEKDLVIKYDKEIINV